MKLEVFQHSPQQLAAGLFVVFCCLEFYEAPYEVKRGLMYRPLLLLCPSVTKYQPGFYWLGQKHVFAGEICLIYVALCSCLHGILLVV